MIESGDCSRKVNDMKVISFLNAKGGVGKTTLSINIATCLARSGHSVVCVETDQQSSIENWRTESCLFDVVEADGERDLYRVRKQLKNYDYVIIDGAAGISPVSAAAVMVSDVVIIPVQPSPLDFSACGAIVEVIEARQALQPVIARFLITKQVYNAEMNAVLKGAIQSTGIEVLRTTTSQRQSHVKSMLRGGTVYSGKDATAKAEYDLIVREIKDLL